VITSTSNPVVKQLIRLRKRRHRDVEHLFVIDGRRPVEIAVRSGAPILRQIICRELGGEPIVGDIPVTEMTSAPFQKASIRQKPDGVMALARHIDTSLSSIEVGDDPLILMVESLEKPGNLGAMLRTADAVGVDAAIVADPTTDVHNPNVVRASQGSVFTVPLAVATTESAIAWLEARSIALVVASPDAATALWEQSLAGPVAVAVGAEATGITQSLRRAAHALVSIPMVGQVDSLNASVAAAVMLFEALRQRRQP
jgi:TrmH family RNA methyltransferase